MKSNNRYFPFLILNLLFISISFAQVKKKESKITLLENQFYQIFTTSNPAKYLKDSVSIYAINFKIEVTRNIKNKTLVTKINANDSLAYQLFPKYAQVKNLDYETLFIKGETKINIILPILIFNHTDEKVKYRDEKGQPLISLKAAANAAYHLYTTFPYDNLKDATNGYPSYLLKYNSSNNKTFTRLVVVSPIISDLTRIR